MTDADVARLIDGALPTWTRRRELLLGVGGRHECAPDELTGALMIIADGIVELECARGGRRRFAERAVLATEGFVVRIVHNVGEGPARVVLIDRQPSPRTGSPGAG